MRKEYEHSMTVLAFNAQPTPLLYMNYHMNYILILYVSYELIYMKYRPAVPVKYAQVIEFYNICTHILHDVYLSLLFILILISG